MQIGEAFFLQQLHTVMVQLLCEVAIAYISCVLLENCLQWTL